MIHRRAVFFTLFIALVLTLSSGFSFLGTNATGSSLNSSISTGTSATSTFVKIPTSLPSTLSEAMSTGSLPASTKISLDFILASRNPFGLTQYIDETNNPLSSNYRHFLSPQDYALLYGPDTSEISALSSYLSTKGLVSQSDPSNPDVLQVNGNAANVEAALRVTLQEFHSANASFFSATAMPQLPAQFSDVQSIYGLTNYDSSSGRNFRALPMARVFGKLSGQPGQTNANFIYYSPNEVYQIYNTTSLLKAGYSGSGVTIAIVDAYGDPYIQQELNNFSAEFHLPQQNITQICVDGPCNYQQGITQGWNSEIALDVQWAHAMAPNASISLYIGSNSSFPLYDAVEQAVTNGSNSIISMSWGSPENSIEASSPIAPVFGPNYPWLDQVLQQAAAEGITTFASTGDWGAYDQSQGESLPYGGAVYPSTDPYVTAVGGTSLYMNTTSGYAQFPYVNATGGYGSETAWSWSSQYGWATGGGYSTLFPPSSWQKGTGFDSSKGQRGVPDVSWDADPATGVAVVLYDPSSSTYFYYVIGGTSVGSPSWAGSLALLDQKAGGRLGLITPSLYSVFNNPAEYSKAFHDITSGNNNPDSAGVGWDPVTGLGTPNLGELSNLIAPTGSLQVSVTNSLSSKLGSSYAYGTQVSLFANVTKASSVISSGTVLANITGPAGQPIATQIPFAFDATQNEWTANYAIKSTGPPGEWTAHILAANGGSSGWGYTTFSVGSGITLFLPFYNVTTKTPIVPVFQVGKTIHVTAAITSPDSPCCVTTGTFRAVFTEGNVSGKVEGTVPLNYNSSDKLWNANFLIPKTADQDSWALTVSGSDSSGNLASTYGWLRIGMKMTLSTDAPSYVLGETMSIFAVPQYTTGLEASTGSYTATVSSGARVISVVPLSLNPVVGEWVGKLALPKTGPTGFYTISLVGNDGRGSAGTAETVVRVAPYNLVGMLGVPSPEISVSGGSEPLVSTKITYPNGSVMSQGSVEAYVFLDHKDLFYEVRHIRMSYDAATSSFVGPALFDIASPLSTPLGNYIVSVQAFDSAGNYGNFTSHFFVKGNSISPVAISGDAQFTQVNGVVEGNGTLAQPYILAGWNTSSISISGGLTSAFKLYNDWVQGSAGNGIFLNTPETLGATLEYVTAASNSGNGIYINDVPAVQITSAVAINNQLSGFVLANVSGAVAAGVLQAVSMNNGLNGFTVNASRGAIIESSLAANNGKFGYYLYNSANATLEFNVAIANPIGMDVTGKAGTTYGVEALVGNLVTNNNVGIEINGLHQVDTALANSSEVLVQFGLIENNTIGLLAENDSEVGIKSDTIGYNDYGIVLHHSLPLVAASVISLNNDTALTISGSFNGTGGCGPFVNASTPTYSSCIVSNFIYSNGNTSRAADGVSLSNVNGSIFYNNLDANNLGSGLVLTNVTGSSISFSNLNNNSIDGIFGMADSKTTIEKDNFTSDLNGLALSSSTDVVLNNNNVSESSMDGVLFSASTKNTITQNNIFANGKGCSSATPCTLVGGIHLENASSLNTISSNSISNTTVAHKIGAGILVTSGSTKNFIFQNNATQNDAGIALSDAPSNTLAGNVLTSNTYGIYLLNSQATDLSSNTLAGNMQDVYPNVPSISFSGIQNGTTVSGMHVISWNSTGQAISNQSLEIDGAPQTVAGTSFSWNSSSLSDGIHVLTIKVTNVAGQTAYSTLYVLTRNHQFLTVETIGPGNSLLSSSRISITNSSYSASATTDASGSAIFKGLAPGNYAASTSINGTLITSPVDYQNNSTVILFVPDLVTTAHAAGSSGSSIPIEINGNFTASQLSNVNLNNSNGRFTLSFLVNGKSGAGKATITIPKNATAGGLTPNVMINGVREANQTFTQDANNYYVQFVSAFNGTSQSVAIELQGSTTDLRYYVVAVVLVAIVLSAIILAFRRPRRKYYIQS